MPSFLGGTNKSEALYATSDDDWFIWGYDGEDWLYGLGGNDILDGGEGADHLNGNGGHDQATYSQSGAGVFVTLASNIGHGYGGSAEGDTLIDIEDIFGSKYDDTLVGNDEENYLDGSYGNDTLKGGGGADDLYGTWGIDTASYETSPAAVVVSLASGLATGGDATGDELYYIENLTGSAHGDTLDGDDGSNALNGMGGIDTLRGGGGPDYIYGGDGDDSLNGADGNDTLEGDGGDDTLSGGDGNDLLTGGGAGTRDVFWFNTALSAATNVDTIMDFNTADDTFWLDSDIFSSLTPNEFISEDQFCVGSSALDAEDRIIYDQTYGVVMYDPDGTRSAPAIQFAQMMLGQPLTHEDFLVL